MPSTSKSAPKFTTIDEYLAPLAQDKRVALEKLRQTVRMLIPQAQECISYQIPAFRLDGKTFFWFGAAANHCAIYAVPQSLANDFKDYDSSGRGTVRFQPDDPIPDKLLSKLVATMVEAIKPPRPKKREQPGSQRRKA